MLAFLLANLLKEDLRSVDISYASINRDLRNFFQSAKSGTVCSGKTYCYNDPCNRSGPW